MHEDIPSIETDKVMSLFETEGYSLIDVRRADEFQGELGHISGSELINLENELESALKEMSKDKKIIFICRSGHRSGIATSLAIDMGFTKVLNMTGGMLKWNKEGRPIES